MPQESNSEVGVQLFYGPPPVLPDVEKQLKEHLLRVDQLPIHNYENAQQFWPRKPDPFSLFHYELSPLGTTLKVDRDPTTGEVLQFREVPVVEDTGCTAKNSMSLRRAPEPSSQSVRGTDANYPFWPGGFPELSTQDISEDDVGEINFEDDLMYQAPRMQGWIKFKDDGYTPCTNEDQEFPQLKSKPAPVEKAVEKEASPAPSLMDIIQQEENLLGLWKESTPQVEPSQAKDTVKTIVQTMKIDMDEELKVIPEKVSLPVLPVLKLGESKKILGKEEWAEEIDTSQPVTDFHEKIPEMAYSYDFELDTFQKQAILKVEKHSNVFVTAHTSAGKTVVAEYAIALSEKHMTKTVYTSPIKALSNQKFRDFKSKFQSVGLITGDMQLNPSASCLIMTTEILRSMLYRGSETVRDLEYVIFDEVHYINNIERGHVWEETLILLPKTVCIIMLSATVPNPLEFANWVGRTKQKKMFVISTLKRPVPLEHYLYTGSTGKQPTSRYLIVDRNGQFITQGYEDAAAHKDNSKGKGKDKYGPRQIQMQLTDKQEATYWMNLIKYLAKFDPQTGKNQLPIVAFTLSRNRCDKNANNITSVDETSKQEKHEIHQFFNKCLQRLKEPDRDLPQVKQMAKLLERGIGVHHSGILPILKEIVEILFQMGKVKVLFATETFAMGVNMPARTVVFDSIRKFDGQGMRPLHPAEYIQMAGRAGRRGLDKIGTVMIACKVDVPKLVDLKSMMLGKPERLTSQFRLTYSMILRLLRVGGISVEDMMSRSFMEFGNQSKQDEHLQKIIKIDEKIAKIKSAFANMRESDKLKELYDNADTYLDLWESTQKYVLKYPKILKELVPGRVLLINHKEHVNKLAMLLRVEERIKQEKTFKVLVLCNRDGSSTDPSDVDEIRLTLKTDPSQKPKEKDARFYKMLALVYDGTVFKSDGSGNHTILSISSLDIVEMAKATINLDPEIILNDYNERQLPRNKDRLEPRKTCLQAIQELLLLSWNPSVEWLSMQKCYKDSMWNERLDKLEDLKNRIHSMNFKKMPNFQKQFEVVFEWKELEREKEGLKYLLSTDSLQLYPVYRGKVKVLEELGYIDKNNAVDLKGRVAIKMRNNELIITELVFRNILKDMPVPEIAALLSSLVFQQKTNSKFKLRESLEKGTALFTAIEEEIEKVEKANDVMAGVETQQKLNFGLVGVVYEWAMEKPFAEIMKGTDVQEGIVVRCIQQLNDTLRDVKDAAISVGDTLLMTKMDEASQAIKRDIVFAASLYTTDD